MHKDTRPLNVEILNPEALPKAREKFTKLMYEAYKDHLIKQELEKEKELEKEQKG